MNALGALASLLWACVLFLFLHIAIHVLGDLTWFHLSDACFLALRTEDSMI